MGNCPHRTHNLLGPAGDLPADNRRFCGIQRAESKLDSAPHRTGIEQVSARPGQVESSSRDKLEPVSNRNRLTQVSTMVPKSRPLGAERWTSEHHPPGNRPFRCLARELIGAAGNRRSHAHRMCVDSQAGNGKIRIPSRSRKRAGQGNESGQLGSGTTGRGRLVSLGRGLSAVGRVRGGFAVFSKASRARSG